MIDLVQAKAKVHEYVAEAPYDSFDWYHKAHRQCIDLAIKNGLPLTKVVGIVAALSPQMLWQNKQGEYPNLELAQSVITNAARYSDNTPISEMTPDWSFRTLPNGKKAYQTEARVANALRILRGEPIETVLTGLKVSSFADNLLRPWSSTKATIDTHCIQGLGDGYAMTKQEISVYFRPKGYRQLEGLFQEVADELGRTVSEVQAAFWVRRKQVEGKGRI